MNAKKFSDAMSELDTKYVDRSQNFCLSLLAEMASETKM